MKNLLVMAHLTVFANQLQFYDFHFTIAIFFDLIYEEYYFDLLLHFSWSFFHFRKVLLVNYFLINYIFICHYNYFFPFLFYSFYRDPKIYSMDFIIHFLKRLVLIMELQTFYVLIFCLNQNFIHQIMIYLAKTYFLKQISCFTNFLNFLK